MTTPANLTALGVIPARLGSTRLPRKMLADIAGQPLIVRTAQAAMATGAFTRVLIATDADEIKTAVTAAGFAAHLTDPALPSGTARVATVVQQLDAAADPVIVNVQGDEPLLDPDSVRRLVGVFHDDPAVEMATLACPLRADDHDNPNAVKVVLDGNSNALYFSRSLIPFPRHREGFAPLKHIGVYAWRRATLLRLVALPTCPLENIESLEQLRALYHGIRIRVIMADRETVGVDTEADLARVRAAFADRVRPG